MGLFENKGSNKNSQTIFLVGIFAVVVVMVWFHYVWPANLAFINRSRTADDVSFWQKFDSFKGQLNNGFGVLSGELSNRLSQLNNVNIDTNLINVNLPKLTNEQIEELKARVNELMNQNSNSNSNNNLNVNK